VNFGRFFEKITPKSFGRYFSEKNAASAKKYCPNGEISPNVVTLLLCFGWRADIENCKRPKIDGTNVRGHVRPMEVLTFVAFVAWNS
jgi:hypothetical protein